MRFIRRAVALSLLLALSTGPALAYEYEGDASFPADSAFAIHQHAHPDDAPIPTVVDVMLTRPLGFVALALSVGIAAAATPILLVSRPADVGKPWSKLVGRSARYVLARPVGSPR